MTDGRALWDREAEAFDEAADHGLAEPECRAAWRALLLDALPPPVVPERCAEEARQRRLEVEGAQRPSRRTRVADLGCGTGTLSLLLAEEGYDVTGVDFSPEMVRRARAKAGHAASFHEADAADPPLDAAAYDAVLCRHVLWALPSPAAALRRWTGLLAPEGRLVLVEGRWSTGAGLTAEQTVPLLRAAGRTAELRRLPDAVYWGREIDDERYLVVSRQ